VNKTDAPTAIGPKAYASWRRTPLGVITEEIEQRLILDLMGDLAGHLVLDVGCGGGALPNPGRDGDPSTAGRTFYHRRSRRRVLPRLVWRPAPYYLSKPGSVG
jgi:hypothetical protein